MMKHAINEVQPSSRTFVHHQLPLILFAVALISFNFSLNYFLQSDNPRPDLLVQDSVVADVAAAEIVASATSQVAILPTNGDLIASGWRTISGDWALDGTALRQTSLEEFDQTIVYSSRTFESYALDVTLNHLTNIGGGVLFNMQRSDIAAGSHLVRFEADGSALYWGYFTEDREFVGQGFAPIDLDFSVPHRIIVKSHATTYDILLDDQLVVENLPLQWKSGHIGLAVSKADVAYENIVIRPIDGVGTVPAVHEALIAQAESITGEWVFKDGTISQLQNEATDYVTALNVLGKTYLLEAEIDMGGADAPADNGAGFIFHMTERESRVGATMVRFMNHGQQVMWGRFDEQNVFRGSGNLALDLAPNTPANLAVRVGENAFDILVNGEEVVLDVPLMHSEGWVGLVAFRGDVNFRDVHLNVGEY